MGQIKLISAIFLTAIFAVAVISFMIGFADDNDANISIEDDPSISTLNTQVTTDLLDVKTSTNSTASAFDESTIESGDETFVTGGVFKSLIGPFTSLKNILGIGNDVIFGDEQERGGFGIILTSLGAFLIIILTLYAWKSWKGNPD